MEVPWKEMGWLGGMVFGLYLALRAEIGRINRRTNGSSNNCEEFRRLLQERIIRLEERLAHVISTDLPASHETEKGIQAAIKDINDQLAEVRSEIRGVR